MPALAPMHEAPPGQTEDKHANAKLIRASVLLETLEANLQYSRKREHFESVPDADRGGFRELVKQRLLSYSFEVRLG